MDKPLDFSPRFLEPFFMSLKIVPFPNLFKYKTCLVLHQTSKNSQSYQNLANLQTNPRAYNVTRNCQLYTVPRARREYSRQSTAYQAAAILNQHSHHFISEISHALIKHKLRLIFC